MENAKLVAQYLLSLDPEQVYFTPDKDGNIKLNLTMHLAQNMYIGKFKEKIFDDDFYASDDGAYLSEIKDLYDDLRQNTENVDLDKLHTLFFKLYFKRCFDMMKNAPVERLIEIDKQDPAWCENGQAINAFGHLEEYETQYEAGYFYLERIGL